MDAFESLAADLYWRDGWWVQTSVKVNLTKEEKVAIGRYSTPRWEIDLVAFSAIQNEVRALECKSYFDSYGVNWKELQEDADTTNYKLFREPITRAVVLERLRLQLLAEGRIREDTKVKLGMIAGKVRPNDIDQIRAHFEQSDWIFHSRDWLVEGLCTMSQGSYSNDVAAVVAKILLHT